MIWRKHQPVSEMVKEVASTVDDTHRHAIASTFGQYDENPLESLWQLQISMLTEISAAKRQLEMAMKLLRATLTGRENETPVTEAILAFLEDHYDGSPDERLHLSCWCDQYEYTLHSGALPCAKTPGGMSAQCADCDGCKACRAVYEGDLIEGQDANGNHTYVKRVPAVETPRPERRRVGNPEAQPSPEESTGEVFDPRPDR